MELKNIGKFALAVSVMSFIAIAPMPYSYYILLRLIVFSFCLLCYFFAPNKYRYFYILLGIIYNPMFPFHLTKMIWILPNLLSGIFCFKLFKESLSRSTTTRLKA